jgi:hypothetical protein
VPAKVSEVVSLSSDASESGRCRITSVARNPAVAPRGSRTSIELTHFDYLDAVDDHSGAFGLSGYLAEVFGVVRVCFDYRAKIEDALRAGADSLEANFHLSRKTGRSASRNAWLLRGSRHSISASRGECSVHSLRIRIYPKGNLRRSSNLCNGAKPVTGARYGRSKVQQRQLSKDSRSRELTAGRRMVSAANLEHTRPCNSERRNPFIR